VEFAAITTYRCNARCQMYNVWQNPTMPKEEVSLATLDRILYGVAHLNLRSE